MLARITAVWETM